MGTFGTWFGAPWDELARVAVTAGLFYLTMFTTLRLAGRRTLARFSAFDIVVTIAMGSLLAGTALAPDPGFARGTVALLVLIVMQVGFAWLRKRVPRSRAILDFRPERIGKDGVLSLSDDPLGAQLTTDEVRSILREKGIFDVSETTIVILEPTGGLSVLTEEDARRAPPKGQSSA